MIVILVLDWRRPKKKQCDAIFANENASTADSSSGTVTAEQRFVLAEPSQIESSFTDQGINTVLQPRAEGLCTESFCISYH